MTILEVMPTNPAEYKIFKLLTILYTKLLIYFREKHCWVVNIFHKLIPSYFFGLFQITLNFEGKINNLIIRIPQ